MNLNQNYLQNILAFLEKVGIKYTLTEEDFDAFLQGITIVNGVLKINPSKLLCVGDILHEAGHIACLPPELRPKASGNIEETLGEEYNVELGVILWSIAAAHHLQIPLTEIFHKEAYLGQSGWLLEQAATGNYVGLPILQWMGMAAQEESVIAGKAAPFPVMLKWIRE